MQNRQPTRGADQSSEAVPCIYEDLIYVRGDFMQVYIIEESKIITQMVSDNRYLYMELFNWILILHHIKNEAWMDQKQNSKLVWGSTVEYIHDMELGKYFLNQ